MLMETNKNFIIILFCLFTSIMIACSDNDNENIGEELKIERSELIFTSSGGTGNIKVANIIGKLSVSSNRDWCMVNVSDNSIIEITVDKYIERENRNAVLTISDDSNTEIHVSVIQNGGIWAISRNSFIVSNKGGEIILPISSNMEYKISTTSWIEGIENQENGYLINVQENSGNKPRKGYVTLKNERGDETSITIIQMDKSDLVGQYTISCDSIYIDEYGYKYTYEIKKEVVIGQSNDDENIFLLNGLSKTAESLTLHFDEDTNSFKIEPNIKLGTYTNDFDQTIYLYTKMYSNDTGISDSNTLFLYSMADCDDNGNLFFTRFYDDIGFTYRSWYGIETAYCNGFAVCGFSSDNNDIDSSTYIGPIEIYTNIEMKKLSE